ncbi:MAG: M15 family metallopeptidase [Armatimonadetes bacterium]|nr:M15 family metallopeptidase [Armatimonadota bacterium]
MNYQDSVPLPPASSINTGLSPARPTTMRMLLGDPRSDYSDECQEVTNPKLLDRIVRRNVGPFDVTGLDKAVASLASIFARVRVELPELYALLRSDGMLCVRKVRLPGGKLGRSPSNHSWGTAIDIKIGERSDAQGDGLVLRGLLALYPYFHQAGWYWGAEFSHEDAMHFEVARETLRKWENSLS